MLESSEPEIFPSALASVNASAPKLVPVVLPGKNSENSWLALVGADGLGVSLKNRTPSSSPAVTQPDTSAMPSLFASSVLFTPERVRPSMARSITSGSMPAAAIFISRVADLEAEEPPVGSAANAVTCRV